MENTFYGFFDKNISIYIAILGFLSPVIILGLIISIIVLVKKFIKKQNPILFIFLTIILGIAFSQVISVGAFCIATINTMDEYEQKSFQNSTNIKIPTNYNPESFYKIALYTSIFPSQKDVYYSQLAIYYQDQKQYKQAIECYENIYKHTKSYQKCSLGFTLGLLYFKTQDYDNAKQIYTAINNPVGIANVYIATKDYEKAINVLDKHIKTLKRNYYQPYYFKAIALKEMGKTDLAKENLNKAIPLYSGNAKSLTEYYNKSTLWGEF